MERFYLPPFHAIPCSFPTAGGSLLLQSVSFSSSVQVDQCPYQVLPWDPTRRRVQTAAVVGVDLSAHRAISPLAGQG